MNAMPPVALSRGSGVPLRLTRRGRVVAATVGRAAGDRDIAARGRRRRRRPTTALRRARRGRTSSRWSCRQGQSLWSVAESADPGQDTRAVIQQIIDLNSLNGDTVFAGQQIWVPRG